MKLTLPSSLITKGEEAEKEVKEKSSSSSSLIKPHKRFTLDYLDHDQREKILKHLKAGKTLKCHHKNCNSFNEEFSTLYEYNMHHYSNHRGHPLHPELSLIELCKLEPRGNPWEDNSCSVVMIKKEEEEIEKGLDFLLSHFNQERLFSRKIQTRKTEGKQIEVFSREEALQHFKESNFVDCRINGFPSYTEYKGVQRYPPDLIFIDIDRSNFENDKQFENALSKTLKISEKLGDNVNPTVNWSGNGYHIILPIECPILEQIEQFQKYQNKNNNNFFISQEFLRFGKDNLSKGKADKHNYPSFKSCQIRIPGSINAKYGVKVKIVQKWNGVRPSITREFIEDFRTYLEQKITDQENSNNNYNNYKYKNNKNSNHYYINNNLRRIEWIETKVLQTPISDYRKLVVGLVLAPYLVVIKKLSYEDSYRIIYGWLQKCDLLSGRRLDFDPKYLINNNIKTSMKKLIFPISINKLKMNYRNLYLLLNNRNNQILSLNKQTERERVV